LKEKIIFADKPHILLCTISTIEQGNSRFVSISAKKIAKYQDPSIRYIASRELALNINIQFGWSESHIQKYIAHDSVIRINWIIYLTQQMTAWRQKAQQ
jgi:hypothetical protein